MMMPNAEGERGSDGRAVNIFVTYLKELPLPAWVEAVRRHRLVPNMTDAETALRSVVRQLDRHHDVFATRDAVLDALQRFECDEGRRLTRSRLVADHLRPATENAALAVLMRRRLPARQFETLYAPFEPDIPAVLLFGLPESAR